MAEQETAAQAVREQVQVAESMAESMIRVWSDLVATTTDVSFGTFERGLRYNQELRAQTDRVAQESVANYGKLYKDGLETWRGYVEGVSEIVARVN